LTKGDEFMVEKIEAPVLAQLLLDKVLLVGTMYAPISLSFSLSFSFPFSLI